LRAWLDEDVEGQLMLRHLAVAADTWDGMGRPSSELYRGVRLDRALEWRTGNAPALSAVETAFLDASQAAADADRQKSQEDALRQKLTNRRRRVLLTAAVAFALVAAVLGLVASTSARRAETQAVTADARRVGAEALTAPMPDTSLLLAAAGMRLEHNSDAAKGNLAAALDRSPLLAHVTRTPPAGAIAVSPTTGQVAVSLTGGGVNLYGGKTLRQVGHATQGGGYAIEYSPDGRLLAANDTPHDLSLTPDPQPIHLLSPTGNPWPAQLGGIRPESRSFWSLAFSSDGRRFTAMLAGTSAGRIELPVWDVDDLNAPVTVLHPDNAHMTAVALSADGRTMFTGGDYFLRVFDVTTGRLRTTRTGSQLGLGPLPFHDQAWTPQVLLSPDGTTLAVTSETEVALLDAATLKPKARITAHGRITSMAFSADNKRLALTDGQVSVWDLVANRHVHVFPSPDSDEPRPVEVFRSQTWGGEVAALSPTGDMVYAANSNGLMLTWDLTGSHGFVTTRPRSDLRNDALAVEVSGDGTKVAYLANIDARIDVRDIATGRVTLGTFPEGNNVYGGQIAWRPDGRAVLEASGDYSVEVRDPNTGALLERHGFGDGVSAAQYTNDGQLIVGSNQGTIQVLDATSLNFKAGPLKPFINERILTLALDPAEHAVALEGSTQRVLVDYRTMHRLRTLPYLTFFAPDGSTSAVVDNNGAVGFQTDHGTRWTTTPDPSHAYGDRASAYSHNSTWFASSRNGQVALWNARTGTFVGSVPVTGPVAVGFTADDSTLVIAGIDGSVRTWNLRPDSWIQAACAIAGRDLTTPEWTTVLPARTPQRVCP
jgi:WD40 repeat protein